MIVGYIYKITNLINNKVYIGQTIEKNPNRRIKRHYKHNNRGKDLVYLAVLKYGKENLKSEVIYTVFELNHLNESEINFIKYYNSLIPNGYNIKLGGKNGGKLLDKTKNIIGKKVKEYYKNNSHPFKDKKFAKEHIEALSKVRKGFDSEARKKARQKAHESIRIKVKAINIKTGEEIIFNSLAEAANVLNLQACNISRVLNKYQNRKQHKGWTFEPY